MSFPADSNPTNVQARALLNNRAAAAGISNPGLSQDDFLAYVVSQLLVGTPAVFMSNLPTVDPAVAGQLWADTNVVKVSAG
jgi:hypothetical protein